MSKKVIEKFSLSLSLLGDKKEESLKLKIPSGNFSGRDFCFTEREKGFTLIELLIVIGIIAVLAAAVIIAINPGQQFRQARNSTREMHIDSLKKALFSYQIYNTGNPPACVPDYPQTVNISECPELDEEYISQTPSDPQGENYMIGFDGPLQERFKVYSTATEYLLHKTFVCGDPVYYEGQIYQSIQIGNQCWFAENLNVGECQNCN